MKKLIAGAIAVAALIAATPASAHYSRFQTYGKGTVASAFGHSRAHHGQFGERGE